LLLLELRLALLKKEVMVLFMTIETFRGLMMQLEDMLSVLLPLVT
jgi:hypothetical protein